jgi:peroxiredoxin
MVRATLHRIARRASGPGAIAIAVAAGLAGLAGPACRAPAGPADTSKAEPGKAEPGKPDLARTRAGAAAPATTAEETGEDHAARARRALVGSRAPSAVLSLLDGRTVALDDLVGHRPIYLKFWATWCVPCREQMPHLESAFRTYGDRVAVIAVDLGLNDPIEDVRAFQAEHQLTVPIAVDRDGSLAERFHVSVTPQHILIDRDGVVRYVGHADMAEINAALEALAAPAAARGAAPLAAPAAPPATADHPTKLALSLVDGTQFSLEDHAGAPVVLSFVSSWCDGYLARSRPAMSAACIAHEHQITELSRSHPGLTWVAIVDPVWTSAPSVDAYRKRIGLSTPIGLDDGSAWFHRFTVRSVPTTILLDAHGTELARVTGRGDDLSAALSRLP